MKCLEIQTAASQSVKVEEVRRGRYIIVKGDQELALVDSGFINGTQLDFGDVRGTIFEVRMHGV